MKVVLITVFTILFSVIAMCKSFYETGKTEAKISILDSKELNTRETLRCIDVIEGRNPRQY